MGSCVIQLNIFRNVTQGENYIQKAAKTFILTTFSAENVTSNTRPADYESAALPTELFRQICLIKYFWPYRTKSYFNQTLQYVF